MCGGVCTANRLCREVTLPTEPTMCASSLTNLKCLIVPSRAPLREWLTRQHKMTSNGKSSRNSSLRLWIPSMHAPPRGGILPAGIGRLYSGGPVSSNQSSCQDFCCHLRVVSPRDSLTRRRTQVFPNTSKLPGTKPRRTRLYR